MMKDRTLKIVLFITVAALTVSTGWSQQLLDTTVDWMLEDGTFVGGNHVDGLVEYNSGSGVYFVSGNGGFGVRLEEGFGSAGDEGYFVYTNKTGSFSLQAKLFPYGGQSALMVRENPNDATSNFYSVELLFDEAAGVIGASSFYRFRSGAGGNVRTPLFDEAGERIQDTGDGLWFRVTRVEPVDVFFGEYSPDGQNWFIADSRVLKWAGDTAGFGIAVGSNANDDFVGEVEISDVEFVSTPPVAQRTISQQSYKGGDTLDVRISVFVSGSDRNTATLSETVPTGWTVSNESNGGTASGGVIRWNLTGLPVGETVVTYRATAPAAPGAFAEWTGSVAESVNVLGPHTLPLLDITGGDRVDDSLVVYYTFNEGIGLTIYDQSGNGAPMDLTIQDPNTVEWGDGYLETTGVNQILSDGPASKIIDAGKQTDALTVEGWIKTSDISQNGPARIITCSLDASNRNFTLGQGRFNAGSNRFEMRYRTTDHNEFQANTPVGSFTEALSHVVWTRAADGSVAAYINNAAQEVFQNGNVPIDAVTGSFSQWNDTYRFGLGNEVSAQRAWLGQFHLVAIYNKALSAAEVSQNYNAGPFIGDDTNVPHWELF